MVGEELCYAHTTHELIDQVTREILTEEVTARLEWCRRSRDFRAELEAATEVSEGSVCGGRGVVK